MKLRVRHHIEYRYTRKVLLSPQQLLLRPREGPALVLRRFRLETDPRARVYWTRDHRDNNPAWAYIDDLCDRLTVHVEFDVETLEPNPFAFLLRPDGTRFPFRYDEAEAAMLLPYRGSTEDAEDGTVAWLREHLAAWSDDTLDFLVQISQTIRGQLRYQERFDPGVQTPEETIARRSGSCRDYAVLMTHLCRALGMAARFVSGYLYDPRAPAGTPAGSLHAWVEIFLPGAGWRGFDPTHAILCDDHFIPVASGRRPDNLNPVAGHFYGAQDAGSKMTAQVEIVEI